MNILNYKPKVIQQKKLVSQIRAEKIFNLLSCKIKKSSKLTTAGYFCLKMDLNY